MPSLSDSPALRKFLTPLHVMSAELGKPGRRPACRLPATSKAADQFFVSMKDKLATASGVATVSLGSLLKRNVILCRKRHLNVSSGNGNSQAVIEGSIPDYTTRSDSSKKSERRPQRIRATTQLEEYPCLKIVLWEQKAPLQFWPWLPPKHEL
jgi:hypothetical protein